MTMRRGDGEAVTRDIPFGRDTHGELLCDVYFPAASADKGTALVLLHGGGFRGGSRQSLEQRLQPYVARGYLAIAAQYRLSGEGRWPEQLHNVKACIRWARANAPALGIDPGRIVAGGFSAGAVLALLAAGTNGRSDMEGADGNEGVSSEVNACVAYYPADEVRPEADGAGHPLLPEGASDDLFRVASPVTHVSPAFPPTVLLHGTADTTFPITGSVRLFQALLEAGAAVEMHALQGQPHIFDRDPAIAELCAGLGDSFLARCLTPAPVT